MSKLTPRWDTFRLPDDIGVEQAAPEPFCRETFAKAIRRAKEVGAVSLPTFFGGIQHDTWKWHHPRFSDDARKYEPGMSRIVIARAGWLDSRERLSAGRPLPFPARCGANEVVDLDNRLASKISVSPLGEKIKPEPNPKATRDGAVKRVDAG